MNIHGAHLARINGFVWKCVPNYLCWWLIYSYIFCFFLKATLFLVCICVSIYLGRIHSTLAGLETMSFMSGGKTVSSSPLEKICPTGRKFVDCLELPHNLFKDAKRNILHNFDHHLMEAQGAANCWRTPDQDVGSLYGQPASLSAENKRVALNGAHYENGLFSSSLLDIFNNTCMFYSPLFAACSIYCTWTADIKKKKKS